VPALAYLVPPLSGLVVYFMAGEERTRWHGLQAVLLGVIWPAALYAGSAVSPAVTQTAAVCGLVVWLAFLVGAASGRDPHWPVAGRWLRALAAESPRAR
jgi:uncharacterized membrane protein